MSDSNYKSKFTAEEWQLLSSAPLIAGFAVSMSDKTGLMSAMQEITTNAKTYIDGGKRVPAGSLVAELAATPNYDALEELKPKKGVDQSVLAAELRQRALDDVKKANDLIEEKAGTTEAGLYRAWVIDIAEQVAKASKSGSTLGFGGEQISAAETALMNDLRTRLGI